MTGWVPTCAAAAVLIALAAGCGGAARPPPRPNPGRRERPPAERSRSKRSATSTSPTTSPSRAAARISTSSSRAGTVRIVRDGEIVSTPALDITDQVTNNDEQGLLSIAFPPDFQSSQLVYAYFTGKDQDQHVVRYSVRADGSFDEGSAREILHMDDFAPNHNGGQLQFGPDGDLYIGTGDGGLEDDPHRNGQNLGSLLGKLLRIRPATGASGPPYTIPPDNPFAQPAGSQAGDLLVRAAQPMAIQLRPKDGRPLDRRRRPEHPRGDRPHREGAGTRRELRLVGVRGDGPLQRRSERPERGAADLRIQPRRRLLDHRRLRRPRSIPAGALRPLRLRRLLRRRAALPRAGDPPRERRPGARPARGLALLVRRRTTRVTSTSSRWTGPSTVSSNEAADHSTRACGARSPRPRLSHGRRQGPASS